MKGANIAQLLIPFKLVLYEKLEYTHHFSFSKSLVDEMWLIKAIPRDKEP